MTLPTDEEVKEYIDSLWMQDFMSHATDAIWKYTKWLREREMKSDDIKHDTLMPSEHRKKTMKDISSPEEIKKAKEFVEMIKDGTIKNRHTTLYIDEIKKYAVKEKEEMDLKESILNLYKTVTGFQDANYKDIVKEFSELDSEFLETMNEMKGTEQPSKPRFKEKEMEYKCKDSDCFMNKMEKQKFQMTEEQARQIYDKCIYENRITERDEFLHYLKEKGYIRKSELQNLVDEAEESIEYLREQSREVKLDQCIDRIEELIQALKKDHPEFKE